MCVDSSLYFIECLDFDGANIVNILEMFPSINMVNSSHFLFIQEHVIEFWQEVMDALGPNIKIAVVEGGIRVEDVRVEEVKVKDVKESKPMATVFCHFGT